jgi:hypothetical protein
VVERVSGNDAQPVETGALVERVQDSGGVSRSETPAEASDPGRRRDARTGGGTVLPEAPVVQNENPAGSAERVAPQGAVGTGPARGATGRPAVEPARPQSAATKPAAAAQPVREIAIRVPESAGEQVDLHVVERGGRVRVDVRTANPQLNHVLRAQVDDLVTQLHSSGYQAEVWSPVERGGGPATVEFSPGQGMQDSPQGSPDGDRGGGQRQPAGQDARQQQSRRSQAAWAEYFDETINGHWVATTRRT